MIVIYGGAIVVYGDAIAVNESAVCIYWSAVNILKTQCPQQNRGVLYDNAIVNLKSAVDIQWYEEKNMNLRCCLWNRCCNYQSAEDNYWSAEKNENAQNFFAWLCRYNDPTFYEKKSHFTIPLYVKQNWISNPKVSKNLSIQPTLVFINLQETCNWVDSSLNDKKRNWQMEITLWNLLKVYRRQ